MTYYGEQNVSNFVDGTLKHNSQRASCYESVITVFHVAIRKLQISAAVPHHGWWHTVDTAAVNPVIPSELR
jgi:hypothetical protein